MRTMLQPTTMPGNVHNVTRSAVGQVVDLTILERLIVFRAIQGTRRPTIIRGNVRNAIVQTWDG
jgi:hypothetical protein